ncbi:hypothetical protein, partial [Ectopseudomonas oleovorans]|uniref:hypothetical protein n=1 Tax=Ectopseudomonas oleovorans TaxID=301 RepID=UPI003F1B69D9
MVPSLTLGQFNGLPRVVLEQGCLVWCGHRLLENQPYPSVTQAVGAGQLGYQSVGADALAQSLLELPVYLQIPQAAHGSVTLGDIELLAAQVTGQAGGSFLAENIAERGNANLPLAVSALAKSQVIAGCSTRRSVSGRPIGSAISHACTSSNSRTCSSFMASRDALRPRPARSDDAAQLFTVAPFQALDLYITRAAKRSAPGADRPRPVAPRSCR